ncbi:hypothetical protein [Bacillus ndiopicus]|nr:hypothetical protein [Bacillus ndiopicus]
MSFEEDEEYVIKDAGKIAIEQEVKQLHKLYQNGLLFTKGEIDK